MDNWSLRSKLILLSLIPTALVVFGLSWTILTTFTASQDAEAVDKAINDSELIAALVSSSVVERDQERLDLTLQRALGHGHLIAAQVTDNNGNILAKAGQFTSKPNIKLKQLTASSQALTLIKPIKTLPVFDNSGQQEAVVGKLTTQYDRSHTFTRRYQLLLVSALCALAALMILGAIASFIGRKTLLVMDDFREALQDLNNGRFPVELKTYYGGATQGFADSINQLAKTIQRNQHQLELKMQQTTTDLQETLDTIEIQNIELNLARKEALQASNSKSDFLANTSHEIRTPLGGIIGFSNLLEKTQLDDQQRDYIEIIKQSAENLHTILNDILDFSRIEAGKMILDNKDFELRPALEHTINIVSPLVTGKPIELGMALEDGLPPSICSDSLRIQQIIINLLANAAKFTEAGSIKLEVSQVANEAEESLVRFAVTDTGIGLDQQQQTDLFQAFAQADSGTSRRYGGSGLGLSISKHLCEMMGGEIGFESQPGKGATFFFTIKPISTGKDRSAALLSGYKLLLIDNSSNPPETIEQQLTYHGAAITRWQNSNHPATFESADYHAIVYNTSYAELESNATLDNLELLNKNLQLPILVLQPFAHEPEARLQPDNLEIQVSRKPLGSEKLARRLLDLLDHKTTAEHMHPTNSHLLSGMEILLVDDNLANLRLVQIIIQDLDASVDTASSGEVAITLCQRKKYDVIFMDIQMPGLSGYETAREIRKEPEYSTTPVIALTAHAMADEKRKILDSGFNEHLTKPVRESEIIQVIQQYFPKAAAQMTKSSAPIKIETGDDSRPVNIQLCLELSNNKPDTARFMLESLINSLVTERDKLISSFESNNHEDLLEQVHKLHGASSYTGTPSLKNAAHTLEENLKKGSTEDTGKLLEKLKESIDLLLQWSDTHDIALIFEDEGN